MVNFVNLPEAFASIETDATTADQPIRRMFLNDGEFVTTNVSIIKGGEDALHVQPNHDEIVIVFAGEAEFRVGEEVRAVGAGDMIFIPRGTLHGPLVPKDGAISTLSIFAPYFDRRPENIVWNRARAG